MSDSLPLEEKIDKNSSRELRLYENDQHSSREKHRSSGLRANQTAGNVDPGRHRVSVFIAGTGAIGSTLIKQISGHETNFNLKVIGACNSSRSVLNKDGIAPGNLAELLDKGFKTDWSYILEQLAGYASDQLILVDATGSTEVARLYPEIMEKGIHIATPSKRANTFEQSFFDRLQHLSKTENIEFHYEPTVGAGLPIISTIRDLLATGDTITEISGSLSGTMTYIFNQLEQGIAFSTAVKKARDLGYAEPDPRDDLSGEDVARKFLTLARTIGLNVERSELDVETLVPQKLNYVTEETFLNELPEEVDNYWNKKIEYAKNDNKTLRYIGKLTKNGISVGIKTIPVDSPLAQLRGTDNLFQIYTRRYSDSPIIIQGPGAGKEVTAAGVLADVLKIAKTLKSRNVNI